jgi:hypothetical protein
MVVLTNATYDSTADVLTALATGGNSAFTTDTAVAANAGILLGFEDSSGDFHIAVTSHGGNNATSDDIDGLAELVELTGVSANDALTADFDAI